MIDHAFLWPDTAEVLANGHLAIGGCDTAALAREFGTPLYVLDAATFDAAARGYLAALARHYPGRSAAHYAGKALLNTAVAQLAARAGLGLDVVSGGELFVALRAGVPAEHIHLHGNAKLRAELQQALEAGVGAIVADSLDELATLARLSAGRAAPQPIMLRVTPDIAADTHAHIQTGHAASKFGFALDALDAAAACVAAAPGLRLRGLHAHIGSQIFSYAAIERAVGVLLDCAARLRDQHGIVVDTISPGGGLGVPYTADQPQPDYAAYVAAISRALAEGCAARGLPLPALVLEPGRSIVARAAVALYEVVATKPLSSADEQPRTKDEPLAEASADPSSLVVRPSAVTRYLHIDGGMADNIRPALYGARYTALLANRAAAAPAEVVHVAGRFCESSDVLLRDVPLPAAQLGDLLAVAVAGAYTLSMASNYNLVPRPALVLVQNGQARLVQRRETYADLAARDVPLG
ncbi:diaminopimelate decarboxylase family protein [Kouleothrix sp.]|uniref:diaminopimelate decarboxylase family protein n=1 Tax=Kouleothrix sp. TaxID=2779161 RepID=UPI00391CEA81